MSQPAASLPPPDRKGLAQAFSAYFLWGLLPLFFAFFAHVDAWEVVANRVIWSMDTTTGDVTLLAGTFVEGRTTTGVGTAEMA